MPHIHHHMNPWSFLPSPPPYRISGDTGDVIHEAPPPVITDSNGSNSSGPRHDDAAQKIFSNVLDSLQAAKFEVACLVQALEGTEGKQAILATERGERAPSDKQHEKATQRVARAKKLQRLEGVVNILASARTHMQTQVQHHRDFLNDLWNVKKEWRLVGVPRMPGTRQAWIESHEPLMFDVGGGVLPIMQDPMSRFAQIRLVSGGVDGAKLELIPPDDHLVTLVVCLIERRPRQPNNSNDDTEVIVERAIWEFEDNDDEDTLLLQRGGTTYEQLNARLADARARALFAIIFPHVTGKKTGVLELSSKFKLIVTLQRQDELNDDYVAMPGEVCRTLFRELGAISSSSSSSRNVGFVASLNQHIMKTCQHAILIPLLRHALASMAGVQAIRWWHDERGCDSTCHVIFGLEFALQFNISGNQITLDWCSVPGVFDSDGGVVMSMTMPQQQQDDAQQQVIRRFQFQGWTSSGRKRPHMDHEAEDGEVRDCVEFITHVARVALKGKLQCMIDAQNAMSRHKLTCVSSSPYEFVVGNVMPAGEEFRIIVHAPGHISSVPPHHSTVVDISRDPFDYLRRITCRNVV